MAQFFGLTVYNIHLTVQCHQQLESDSTAMLSQIF